MPQGKTEQATLRLHRRDAGKVACYWVYDVAKHRLDRRGHRHDTAANAVATIEIWLNRAARAAYLDETGC